MSNEDLIITNEINETGQIPASSENNSEKGVEEEAVGFSAQKEDDDLSGKVKKLHDRIGETGRKNEEQEEGIKQEEQDQSFREALREQIHEDEQPLSQKISVIKILGGDFFTSQILRRQIGLILLIFGFVIVYVSNRYSCQKSMLEIDHLQDELLDAKYKALSTSSRLTERSRQSRVLDMLKENNDSVLHIATQPPYIILVPEE